MLGVSNSRPIQTHNRQIAHRLFCFTYAGGAASIYRDWSNQLPQSIEVHAVQFPGHGNQLNKPLFRRVQPLPEPEFIEELKKMGGTPQAVLEHPELMSVLNPILRADLEVCQTYEYEPRPPLDCPSQSLAAYRTKKFHASNLKAGATTQRRPSPFECSPGITSTCIQPRMSCCG